MLASERCSPLSWPWARLLLVVGAGVFASALSCAHKPPAKPTAAPVVPAAPVRAAVAPSPPPLALVPVDVARTGLVASFVVPSLERALADGVALVKQAAPLPLDATGVRDMLLAQAGLSPEVAQHLDTSAPIAGAAVLNSRAPSALTAFAFAARSASSVPALLGALGRPVSRRGDAVQIENATGDRGWFLPEPGPGAVIVFADTDEALVRAGSVALEARRQTKDALTVRLYPEMMARAAGFALDAGLDQVRRMVEERVAAGGSKLGPDGARQVRSLIDYAGDTATAELALDLEPARGATVFARLTPKPGSKLEALARETGVHLVDSALRQELTRLQGAGLVLSSAYGGATLAQLARVRANLPGGGSSSGAGPAGKVGDKASERAGSVAGRLFDALLAGLSGPLSLAARAQPTLSAELVLPVRDGAAASGIEVALLASDKEAWAAILRTAIQGQRADIKDVTVQRVRRETVGKTRSIHAIVELPRPAKLDPALAKLWGPRGTDVFAAIVSGPRLALTMGPGAKERLAAIAASPVAAARKRGEAAATPGKGGIQAKATPTTTAVSGSSLMDDAVGAAGTRSLFYLLDVRQLMSTVAAGSGDPRSQMLSRAMRTALPVFGGAMGDSQGKALTLDLVLPTAFFGGVGAVLQAAMISR